MGVPVYLFTGFLESGKTTLIKDTIASPDFADVSSTLLILCEEGEEEYDPAFCSEHQVTVVTVENKEDMTEKLLEGFAGAYDAEQVMIEYNGTWEMDLILDMDMPEGWELQGIYTTVNADTADSYLANMRQMFLEPMRYSNLIIVNRSGEQLDKLKLRRTVKVFNPRAQLVFERPDGTPEQDLGDELPYDLSQSFIELESFDYGLWYLDVSENPKKYNNKTFKFLAQVYKGKNMRHRIFVPGRFIMTCCANDVQFLGYLCRYSMPEFPYQDRDWVTVTVTCRYEFAREYGKRGPVLYLQEILPAKKPEEELVYF
ncbi:TIGR03943 family putative permease subunit [Cuneatibacter caecimuris]|uniref:CobW/HypB/UreG family nucleotide-binding protein n=1 Tax=Cuneatibacter caecimuris TaxID=1796618 RepID=A0A4Q7NZ39_9FIRM|nr:GTP-binding protein [Cuneatibacter caecimuris]RZS92731.1 CobW/HypB/UreG family nucleotide-binding protein [Cuneatibacter caecimuris]